MSLTGSDFQTSPGVYIFGQGGGASNLTQSTLTLTAGNTSSIIEVYPGDFRIQGIVNSVLEGEIRIDSFLGGVVISDRPGTESAFYSNAFFTSSISTTWLVGSNIDVSTISTGVTSAHLVDCDSISTSQLDLDGQLLTANATQLLLNNFPLATLSNLSSIADWSLDPAISTVQLAGNDVIGGGSGYFSTLDASFYVEASNAQTVANLNASGVDAAGMYLKGNTAITAINIREATSSVTWYYEQGNVLYGQIGMSPQYGITFSDNYVGDIDVQISSQTLYVKGAISTPSIIANSGVFQDISTVTMTVQSTIHAISTISSLELEAQAGVFSTVNSGIPYTTANPPPSYVLPTNLAVSSLVINNTTPGAISFCNIAGNMSNDGITYTAGIYNGYSVNGSNYFGNPTTIGNSDLYNANLIVNGGATLDGGTVHGTTIGCLPVLGVNTVRIDVLPAGITEVSPTFITLNCAGAGNFAAGGALSLAAGDYVEINTGEIQCINTTSGESLVSMNHLQGNSHNGGSGRLYIDNLSSINGQPLSFYEPGGVSTISSFVELYTSSLVVSSITANGGGQVSMNTNLFFSTTLVCDGGGGGGGTDGATLGNWKEIDVGSAFLDTIGALSGPVVTFQSPINSSQVIVSSITDQASTIVINNAGGGSSVQFDDTGSIFTTATRYINSQTNNGLGGTATLNMSGNGLGQMTATDQIGIQAEIFQVLSYAGNDTNSLVINQAISTIGISAEAEVGLSGGRNIILNSVSTLVSQGSMQLGVSSLMLANTGFAQIEFYNAQNSSTSQILGSALAIQSFAGDPNVGFYTRLVDNRAAYVDSNFSTNRLAYVTDSNISISSITVSSINGSSYGPTSAWASFSAVTNIDASGYNLNNVSTISNPAVLDISGGGAFIKLDTTVKIDTQATGQNIYLRPGGSVQVQGSGALDVSVITGVSSINNTPFPTYYTAGAYSVSTQTVLAANTPLALDLGTLGINTGGFTIHNSTITVPADGYYQLTPSIQFDTASNQIEVVDFWITKNGNDLANSASRISVAKNAQQIGTVVVVDKANTGDEYGVKIASSDNNMTAAWFSSITTPYTRPDIPSVILNIQQVAPAI